MINSRLSTAPIRCNRSGSDPTVRAWPALADPDRLRLSSDTLERETFCVAAFASDDCADAALVQAKCFCSGTLRFEDLSSLVTEDLLRHQSRIYQAGLLSVLEVLGVCTPLKVFDAAVGFDARNVVHSFESKGIRKEGLSHEAMNAVGGLLAVFVEDDAKIATAQAGPQDPLFDHVGSATVAHQPRQALHLAFNRNLVTAFKTDYVSHSPLIRLARVRTKLMIKRIVKL